MKHSARKLLAFGLVFLTHGIVHASPSRYVQNEFRYDPQERNLRIVIVTSRKLESELPAFAQRTNEAIHVVEQKLGERLREGAAVFFDVRPDFHNGLTTVLPTNRILVHTEAPEIESSIGIERDFILETLVHEFAHMVTLQQRRGVFNLFDKVLGNSSRPIGAWPRWMHEGLAVWTEEALGGRPGSGYVDFDLRKYADYFSRTGQHPLHNYDLDGSRSPRKIEVGEIPYHFGYLVLKSWTDQVGDKKALGALFHQAEESVGLSFRIQFRAAGLNLDQHFEEQRKKWATTPMPVKSNSDTKPLVEEERIAGPWASTVKGHRSLNWIESNDLGQTDALMRAFVQREPEGGPEGLGRFEEEKSPEPERVTTQWRLPYSSPSQAFLWDDQHWLVSYRLNPDMEDGGFYDPYRPPRVLVGLFDRDGLKTCHVNLPEGRVREIYLNAGRFAWIRSTDDGFYFAEESTLGSNCELGTVKILAKSDRRFQRLSSIFVDSRNWLLSRGPFETHSGVETLEWNGARIEAPFPLAVPSMYRGNILAQEYSKERWGPVLIRLPESQVRAGEALRLRVERLPVRTGSFRSALASDGRHVIVKESLWERDQLQIYDEADFTQGAPSALMSSEQSREPQANPNEVTSADASPAPQIPMGKPESYGPWPSIWPHFWLPSAAATTGGFLFMGETFYSDLTADWQGASALGYDSSLKRPFVTTGLQVNSIHWGPFASFRILGYYLPVYNYAASVNPAQDRWGAQLRVVSSALFPQSGIRFDLAPELGYIQAARAEHLNPFAYAVPAVTLSIQSMYGQRYTSPFFRLSSIRPGFVFDNRLRYFKDPELYQSFQAQWPFYRTGFHFALEYGQTTYQNFPASYFEWGGLYPFSTSLSSFLSRGFSPQLAAAKAVFRTDLEWGFRLATLQKIVSWNRMRISHADMRFLVESVSWSSFTGSRYRIGRQWFTTVGSEVDVWGAAAHYVTYKVSVGAYKGFGPFGDLRFAVVLRNALDL